MYKPSPEKLASVSRCPRLFGVELRHVPRKGTWTGDFNRVWILHGYFVDLPSLELPRFAEMQVGYGRPLLVL